MGQRASPKKETAVFLCRLVNVLGLSTCLAIMHKTGKIKNLLWPCPLPFHLAPDANFLNASSYVLTVFTN